MKLAIHLTLSASLLACGLLHAQNPVDPLIEPVEEVPQDAIPGIPTADLIDPGDGSPALPPPASDLPPADVPPPTDLTAGEDGELIAPAAGAPFGPLEEQKQEMQQSDEGFIIKDAGLNDIFQFLAKSAGRQYFHNSKISGPDFLVTGHLNDGNPLAQMEELAFMYGLSLHTKGNTIYALTQAQLAQLPSTEFHYQLRYLRPTDMEQIKELIKPMLSPGTGIVNFEPKTNTIIIIDSAHRIEQARSLLHGIDNPKGQIVVETKILRINSSAAERTGVNWASSLGENGTSLSIARDLNSVFGLPSTGLPPTGANLVLNPVQLNGVLRALANGGLASQVSNPTLITEDNEQATISIIDRIPIVTSTITQATTGGEPTVTEEVRYKIDESDVSIDADPEKHREIGISLVVTPTLLPDGTVRMRMRPRSAQIVASKSVTTLTGNTYPFVVESMVESITRVPDGHSLVIGGFYGEENSDESNKVPLLGDIPVLNFFFKSKETVKEKTSLVFIVTPKSYNPASRSATGMANRDIRATTTLDCDHDWINEDNPGPAHQANMKRSIRGLQPTQAPYYPRAEELQPKYQEPVYQQPAATQPRFSRGRK